MHIRRLVFLYSRYFSKRLWCPRSRRIFLALTSVGFTFQSTLVSDEEFVSQPSFENLNKQGPNDGWEHVYEGKSIKVMRRKLKEQDLYEYRCFGSYDDISPTDFVDAQFDNNYRLSWDDNISVLEVLEEDKETKSEIIQWITKFPYPMYPRLYLFVRRKIIDEEQRKITVICSALDQSAYEGRRNGSNVRVTEYKSKLTVWARKSFDEDGLSYLLSYHEDPKSSIPSFAYNYIVNRTGPAFMERVHQASKIMKATRPEKKPEMDNEPIEDQSLAKVVEPERKLNNNGAESKEPKSGEILIS